MVGRVVREIRRQAPDFDVVVVDDGSTDNTASEAEAAGAIVLRHPFNTGIGGAMQSGFKYALRHSYDVAAQVDGDGQHKPAHLDDLLAKLQTTGDEADMVCGSRFRGDPGYKVPIGRRAGNLIFSVVLTAICRQRISDPTSGFRMTNRRGIELFARDYPHDYPEVEAILMLHAHRLRIHEVPVRMNARGFGRSSIDYPRSAYYMAKVLLALFVGLFRRRPTPMEERPHTSERTPSEPPAGGPRSPAGTSDDRPELGASPPAGDDRHRARIVAVIVTAIMLGVGLELVRRRRLVERYALLWLLAALALLVLAVWNEGRSTPGRRDRHQVPPNARSIAGLGVASSSSFTSRSRPACPRRRRSSPRRSRGSTQSTGGPRGGHERRRGERPQRAAPQEADPQPGAGPHPGPVGAKRAQHARTPGAAEIR